MYYSGFSIGSHLIQFFVKSLILDCAFARGLFGGANLAAVFRQHVVAAHCKWLYFLAIFH